MTTTTTTTTTAVTTTTTTTTTATTASTTTSAVPIASRSANYRAYGDCARLLCATLVSVSTHAELLHRKRNRPNVAPNLP
eukprot:3672313-Pyramimonas_sp.AAC.1